MDYLIQTAGLITVIFGGIIVIRKEMRDTQKHQWERQDRGNRELRG